jgi:hypothetical protein
MKTIKHAIFLGLFLILTKSNLYAQWQVNGNGTPAIGPTQFLGTINNEFLRIRTNNQFRMKINPTINYQVNLLGLQPRDGFTLIGRNTSNGGGTGMIYDNNWGAYSLLHLNGEGTFVEEWGYRNWMQTGITLTGNRDLSYIGLNKLT